LEREAVETREESGARGLVENEGWRVEAMEVRSMESVSDLLANRTSSRLPRMTLWLLDANSEEIRELWETLKERDELDHKTGDLIMVHWTEIDPEGALAEVRGTGSENVAWWRRMR
jgi:hypothetical protein